MLLLVGCITHSLLFILPSYLPCGMQRYEPLPVVIVDILMYTGPLSPVPEDFFLRFVAGV